MHVKVSTVEKKNVLYFSSWRLPDCCVVAAGKSFIVEEGYRWGYVTVDVESVDDIPDNNVDFDGYDIVDQEFDDGVSVDFHFTGEWSEDEREYVERLWDEGVFYDTCEDDGESTIHFYGDVVKEVL